MVWAIKYFLMNAFKFFKFLDIYVKNSLRRRCKDKTYLI